MDLGEKIKKQRERMGLSQPRFGELVETGARGISYWENGVSKPSIEQLEKLSEVCNVPITYWFSADEETKKDDVTALIEKLLKSGKIKTPDDVTPEVMTAIELTFKKYLAEKVLEQLD